MRVLPAASVCVLFAFACAARPVRVARPFDSTFRLAGQFNIPPLTRFPGGNGPRFGGISGLAPTAATGEYLGISDDQTDSRIYRFRVSDGSGPLEVAALGYIPLGRSARAPSQLDPESIAVGPDGQIFIVSEGIGNVEPRLPPSLLEFDARGTFVRQLVVRERYVPNPHGAIAKGVRSNLGFESLCITPDGQKLFLGTESAIVQDGGEASFARGADARILEYVRRAGTYEPRREFLYRTEPIHRPDFAPGFAVNGLVDLIALEEEGAFLALERSYVAEAGETGRGANRIRLFRISLNGATDISSFDSLRNAGNAVPGEKTLLLDLSDVNGLGTLAPDLDNFEAMAVGPMLPGGRRSLLLVSDDNFNPTQQTWFLLFRPAEPGASSRYNTRRERTQ